MTKETFIFRKQAVGAAARLGYAGFRTHLGEDEMWRLSYTHGSDPAAEWLTTLPAERRQFVHHTEVYHRDGAVVPVLVVNVTREELLEEGEVSEHGGRTCLCAGGAWFEVEPVCAELWHTDVERQLARRERNAAPRERQATEPSTVDSPVRLVWEVCDSMPGAERRDVVAACVARGVNKSTASVQYGRWLRARESEADPKN